MKALIIILVALFAVLEAFTLCWCVYLTKELKTIETRQETLYNYHGLNIKGGLDVLSSTN